MVIKTIVQSAGRLLLTVLLTMWCMVTLADVTVDTRTFIGGSVEEKSQSVSASDGSVTVTLTVTPASGYAISKNDILVVATLPVNLTRADAQIGIGDLLTLEGEDPDDLTLTREYTVTVSQPFGIYVMEANFQKVHGFIDGGIYRIGFVSGNQHWYLWPSVNEDGDGHPYLTTFNDISAPALDYSAKGVQYDAFDEQYSQWQVYLVEQDGATYYQLKNVALQQYVVWSDVSGEKVVHLEELPADESRTLFRFDGEFPNVLITPAGAAEGTTLNSKAGDKPFLSSSGEANAATGYPEGEPDANGDRGLMQIYNGTPVWTLEEAGTVVIVQFDAIGGEDGSQAATFVAQEDYAVPEGIRAYIVTGVDLNSGQVILTQLDYLPAGVPTILVTDETASEFILCSKSADTPAMTDEEIAANLLRVGSPEVQPTSYEDFVFIDGMFYMMGRGTLPTGMVFLDLNQEQASRSRGLLTIGGVDGTTGITEMEIVENRVEGWFTLDGRRLSTAPVRKGMYIHNGKKVIVK